MLTTKQVEEAARIKSDTLRGHARRGWLPEPVFKSLGRGGASLYWPKSVLAQLELIKILKKAGYRSQQIDTILKGEGEIDNEFQARE